MMRLFGNRRVLGAAAGIGGLLVVALWPATVDVDVAVVGHGPLIVTVDEEGRTRVRERFVVSSPVAGRVLRIELEPGDRVARGDVVARVRPEPPPLLDARTRAEAEATVKSSAAALGHARVEEQRARTALAHAERELARSRRLAEAGVTPSRDVDAQEAETRLARETADAAAFAVTAAAAELQRVHARLAPPPPDRAAAIVTITAPVDGVVLRRLRESESAVPAGDPLIEIGNPLDMEVVTDLLSTDAVGVRPGARATIEQWGGEAILNASVRRVEPAGFTRVSALGVEEQRVNVVLDFADPAGEDAVLGDGYRVEVRIVVWESPRVLKVPTSALFRDGERWAVYVADGARARRTCVELGRQTGREAEVVSGLTDGVRVIVHPGDLIADGVRIRERSAT